MIRLRLTDDYFATEFRSTKKYTIPMVNFATHNGGIGGWKPYGPFIPVDGVLDVTGALVEITKTSDGTTLMVSRPGNFHRGPPCFFTWYSSNSFDDIVDDFDRHLAKQKLLYDSRRFQLDGPEYQKAIKEMTDVH